MYTGKLNSIKTHLPYDLYEMGFCPPKRFEKIANKVGDKIT